MSDIDSVVDAPKKRTRTSRLVVAERERTPRQRLLNAFGLLPTLLEVSQVTGVPRSTIYQLMRDDEGIAQAVDAMRARVRKCPACGHDPEASHA